MKAQPRFTSFPFRTSIARPNSIFATTRATRANQYYHSYHSYTLRSTPHSVADMSDSEPTPKKQRRRPVNGTSSQSEVRVPANACL